MVQPVLLPPSTELLAVNVAPPPAAILLSETKSTTTLPLAMLILVGEPAMVERIPARPLQSACTCRLVPSVSVSPGACEKLYPPLASKRLLIELLPLTLTSLWNSASVNRLAFPISIDSSARIVFTDTLSERYPRTLKCMERNVLARLLLQYAGPLSNSISVVAEPMKVPSKYMSFRKNVLLAVMACAEG